MSLLWIATRGNTRDHAIASMAAGLFLLWCGVGGGLMWRLRDRFAGWVARGRLRWQVKFVLGCTAFALLEEAVAVLMTNLAPVFGARVGEAYITASTNYFEVVLKHSVVVFVPMFICWALLLTRWAFAPVQAMVLFGLTGTLAESITFGMHHLLGWGFWLLVYGLMVYLPAYAVREQVGVLRPRLLHAVLAVILPLAFAIPVVLVLALIQATV